MPVVTPADILTRCQLLDQRILVTTRAIQEAPMGSLDDAFRNAWVERLKRWAPLRLQCSDWGSRWWNFKWGPILDDWEQNESEWEARVTARTGRVIPAQFEAHERASDETVNKFFGEMFGPGPLGSVGKSINIGIVALGVGAGLGLFFFFRGKGGR